MIPKNYKAKSSSGLSRMREDNLVAYGKSLGIGSLSVDSNKEDTIDLILARQKEIDLDVEQVVPENTELSEGGEIDAMDKDQLFTYCCSLPGGPYEVDLFEDIEIIRGKVKAHISKSNEKESPRTDATKECSHLRNKKTGIVFIYSDELAKLTYMEPCSEPEGGELSV